jgi:hypothetical protein
VNDQVSHPSCMIQQNKLLTVISTAHFHARDRISCYRHKVTFTTTLQFLYQSHDGDYKGLL